MTAKEKPSKNISLPKTMLLPKEEMLEIKQKGQKIKIGMPSDFSKVEYRVPLTPQAVELLVSYGHEIYIEKDAGKSASYLEEDYRNAGAVILDKKEEVLQCDIIIRVSPFDCEEIEMLKGNQVILSNMQIQAHCNDTIQKLMKKKVTCIAFEYMQDEKGSYPIVQQMSQISGISSITIASEYLSKSRNGKGVLFGDVTGITPSELVIIGSGTAAEFAARAALGLGVMVKVFDSSVHDLSQLEKRLGQRIFTSVFYPKVLKKALISADAVIGAMPLNKTPKFKVSEEMVETMKEGTVIIDLNMSQGGCFETSKCTDLNNPTFEKHGVVHYCVPNIPALVARTASISFSNILIPVLLSIGESGSVESYIKNSRGFRRGVYIYHGILTNHEIGNFFNIPSKDIDLLLAIF